jgi:hypothetical protein
MSCCLFQAVRLSIYDKSIKLRVIRWMNKYKCLIAIIKPNFKINLKIHSFYNYKKMVLIHFFWRLQMMMICRPLKLMMEVRIRLRNNPKSQLKNLILLNLTIPSLPWWALTSQKLKNLLKFKMLCLKMKVKKAEQ